LNKKGFILTELLIASLIVVIFSYSFFFMLRSGIKAISESKKITRSVLLCKSIMEEIKSVPAGDVFVYNNKKFDNGAGRISVRATGSELISISIKHKVELNSLRPRTAR